MPAHDTIDASNEVLEPVHRAQSEAFSQNSTDNNVVFSLDLPNSDQRSLRAAASKAAGRINASTASEKEYNDLLAERQKLLDRKFSGEITRRETNRLAYVRWSLDRIEDAKYGASLDILEDHVIQYENLLREIGNLTRQLETHTPKRRK